MIRWNVKDRAARRGWTNARQLSLGATIGYPAAWRIMQGEPLDRLDIHTLETLTRAFGLKTPWALLTYTPD